MKQWYLFYSNPEHSQKLKQAVSQFETFQKTHPLVVEQVGYSVYPEEELKQAVSVFPKLFAYIGWSHHIAIMQKCKSIDEALFYISKTIEQGMSRAALINCIKANL